MTVVLFGFGFQTGSTASVPAMESLARFFRVNAPARVNDPQELKSVWSDPKYADARKELEVELARLRKELKVPEEDPTPVKK